MLMKVKNIMLKVNFSLYDKMHVEILVKVCKFWAGS